MRGPIGDDGPEVGPIPKSGPIVPKSAPQPEWVPIPDKKHFYRNAKGEISYRPPEPSNWITPIIPIGDEM